MQRNGVLIAIAVVGFGMASMANAASVVLSASSAFGQNVVGFGDTLTLTVTVTADAGEIDTSVYGAILYNNSLASPLSKQQNALPPTANGPWNQGVLPACTTALCRAFSQTNAGGAVGVTNFVIATMQFVVFSNSTVTFNWQSAPIAQRLDFFGVTSAPGITVTVVDGPIPEPTTAALLGAGLIGLALASRAPRPRS